MGPVYELIGRLAVKLIAARYRRQLRIAGALALAAALAIGYAAATREPPEG